MKYRQGVGAFIINNKNSVLLARRIDHPSALQLPQGGIDAKETPKQALFREIKEELGIYEEQLQIIGHTEKLKYIIPKELTNNLWDQKYIGQEQLWFFLKFLGQDKDIDLNASDVPEFISWEWTDPQLIPFLSVEFKKELYHKIIKEAYKKGILS